MTDAFKVDGRQPIETAPKDGTRFLATNGELVSVACWGGYGQYWSNDWVCEAVTTHTDGPGSAHGWWDKPPTHWWPLPSATTAT